MDRAYIVQPFFYNLSLRSVTTSGVSYICYFKTLGILFLCTHCSKIGSNYETCLKLKKESVYIIPYIIFCGMCQLYLQTDLALGENLCNVFQTLVICTATQTESICNTHIAAVFVHSLPLILFWECSHLKHRQDSWTGQETAQLRSRPLWKQLQQRERGRRQPTH